MDERGRILDAGTDLLTASPDGDISIRMLCAAANVTPATVYRHFSDRATLIVAIAQRAFDAYFSVKEAHSESDDPVQDIKDGWDAHLTFALDHPNHYKAMFIPGVRAPISVVTRMHELLVERLERCAATRPLAIDPETGARMILATNTGAALSMISRPGIYSDRRFFELLRDGVMAAIAPSLPQSDPAGEALTSDLANEAFVQLSSEETARVRQLLRAQD